MKPHSSYIFEPVDGKSSEDPNIKSGSDGRDGAEGINGKDGTKGLF